jgi:hypothetical protein
MYEPEMFGKGENGNEPNLSGLLGSDTCVTKLSSQFLPKKARVDDKYDFASTPHAPPYLI